MLAGDAAAAITADVSSPTVSTQCDTVVFVDAAVEELATVAKPIADGAELVLLRGDVDGVEQIRTYLEHRRGVRAVHIISHGSTGQVQLGSTTLAAETLSSQAENIRGWGTALTDDADLLIYGCDVASTPAGTDLVREIARLTGADVAASNDRTANARHGGDWELEYQLGTIESAVALTPQARDAFEGHLAIEIRAAGSYGNEEMELQIGDEVVASWTVTNTGLYSNQFESYVADIDGADINEIRINFVNAIYNPAQGIDNNLGVDWIRVDGVQYETEAPEVYSTGTWAPGVGIVPGFKQSEILHGNGYFQYADNSGSGDGSTIRIFASGDTGDEQMELQIDGVTVATYGSIPTGGDVYTFVADDVITADQIRVAFVNAEWAPGYDQNLLIDRIEIDGVTFETEDPSVFSTAGWAPGVGLTSGFLEQEKLFANGHFQFDAPPQTTATIEFQSDNFVVTENAQSVSLIVTRQGDLDQTSSVMYSVPGGFAVPGEDFTPVEDILTFNPGESTKTFSVPIINDDIGEGVETFTVALSDPVSASLGVNRTTIVTVVDDDNVNPPGSLNVQLPDGFISQRVASNVNFAGPTGLKVADDGRVFVTEKFGRIYVVENGQRVETPFLDLTSEVYSVGTSQGLAGFALDPNFSSNGHVYVLYTTSQNGTRFGRLERYTVSSSDANQIDTSTRLILIGTNASNGFPDGGDIHLVGDLKFGNDGSLLISYGDAAGNGDNNAALNSQNLDNLGGVIARVNPATGDGYASNPFATADLSDVRSKIWAYGLRNPYRFEVAADGSTNPDDGNPGTLYIGEVQYNNWEELNIARGGENFGWPYFQGNDPFFGNESPEDYTAPAVTFTRAEAKSSIGGAIIGEGTWPTSYQGRYLHADYVAGWIRSFALDEQGEIIGSSDFATGANGITDMEWDPGTQQLYFVALNQANNFQGELYAISYVGSNTNQFEPTEVSTGSDGVAFAVTTLGEVWRRDGSSWTQLPGNFEKVTVRNANEVWGLDSFGNLSQWDGVQWQSMPGQPLNDIGVSVNGDLWGVGATNNVLQRVDGQWVSIGGTLVDIEVDPDGVVWGVNPTGQIWKRAAGQWTRIGGTLTDISVGADGSVWGTNAQNEVWRRVGNGWEQQSIALHTISVTIDTDVWGVDPNGQIQRWDGVNWQVV